MVIANVNENNDNINDDENDKMELNNDLNDSNEQ